MKIAVLSDTHNNRQTLAAAIEHLRREEVEVLFHCGDLTDPRLVDLLVGFEVHYTWGNGDLESGEIERLLREANPESSAGLTYTGELEGRRIASTHGHLPDWLDQLIAEERYDYIFHGHSHRSAERVAGSARVINPGALGGMRPSGSRRSFALLDLALDELEFVELDENR